MNKHPLRPGTILAALALTTAAAPAFAQSSGAVPVTAVVNAQCAVVSTSQVNFGALNVLGDTGSPTNAQGSVTIRCNKGAAAAITASSAGGSGETKRMLNGSDALVYNILRPTGDSLDACPPSAGTELGTTPFSIAGLWASAGGPQTIPICGRIDPAQPGVAAGTYSDTVMVTVTY